MSEVSFSIGLVAEGPDDVRVTKALFERCLLENLDWLDETQLPQIWESVGLAHQQEYLSWKAVPRFWSEINKSRKVALFGNFDGKKPADFLATKKALTLLRVELPNLKAVILVRDTDGKRDGRGVGIACSQSSLCTAVGIADPKVEAWLLAAFDAIGEEDVARLKKVKADLGFDPRVRSKSLNSSKAGEQRNAKEVVDALGGTERCIERLREATWSMMMRHETQGGNYGLISFKEELSQLVETVFK